MLELRTKIKRQIEIVGLSLNNGGSSGYPLTGTALAQLFGVENLTIKRDLRELRSYGIDIHSEKRRGVHCSRTITPDKLKSMILQYIGLCYSEQSVDRSTSLMISRLKERSLANIVTLQRCIEQSRIAMIDYQKERDILEKDRVVQPVLIYQSDHYWRMVAKHDGILKQYLLNKIVSVRSTQWKVPPVPKVMIEDLFRHAWRSWLGSDKYYIKLKFSKAWAKILLPHQMMEHETCITSKDGSVTYQTTVNSLEEVASWVASKGEGVVVLEPVALKAKVVEIAKGALKNYSSKK